MPKPKTKPNQCRACSDERYAVLLEAVAQGLSVLQAARVADLHHTSAYRHRPRCAVFGKRLSEAERAGAKRRDSQPRRPPAHVEAAQPIIAAHVAAGASRAQAAKRAGVRPSDERVWMTRYPSYRDAIEHAQARARQ